MANITVVGSSNTDMVVRTDRIPSPGETVIGGEFAMVGGGKGANQAVAAARLGADVTFVACVGRDVFGDQAVASFEKDGIRTGHVFRHDESPSGVALIFVDEQGENVIVVAPGANGQLSPWHVQQAGDVIRSSDTLVCQLEVPLPAVLAAVDLAHKAGVRVILNPAPACALPPSLLQCVDILTPNQTEAALLADLSLSEKHTPENLGARLLDQGVGVVILTLGSEGACIVTREGTARIPAPTVHAVDTTAAGDAFNGALAVALSDGQDLEGAVRFATRVAALSVTRVGAQPSLPTRQQVENFTP